MNKFLKGLSDKKTKYQMKKIVFFVP